MTKLVLYFSMLTMLCLEMYGEVVQSPVNTLWDSQNGRYLVVQNNRQLLSVDSMMTTSNVLLTLNSPASICIQDSTLYIADVNKILGYELSTMKEVYRYQFKIDASFKGITGDNNGTLYLTNAINNSIIKFGLIDSSVTKLNIDISSGVPKGLDYLNDNLYITATSTPGINSFVYQVNLSSNKLRMIYYTTTLQGINSITHDKFGDLYFCFYGAGSTNGVVVKCSAIDFKAVPIKSNMSMPTSITYREDIESLVLSLNPTNEIALLLVGTARKTDLIYPTNNAKIDESRVVFKWNKIQGVAGYHLWVSKDKDFADTLAVRMVNSTNNISPTVPLDTNQTYYWKVRGHNLDINGKWSETFAFTTGNVTFIPPTLVSPINGATSVSKRPTLVWNRASGGIYEIEISSRVDFSDIKYHVSNVTDTFHTVDQDLAVNSEYYWRVRAYASIEYPGYWSIPFGFNTFATAPAAPELFYPGDYKVNIPRLTVLEWMSVPNTKLYKLEISTRSDFLSSSTKYFEIVPLNSSKEVLQLVDSLEPFTYYYWRVRGQNDYGLGPWSSERVFQTVNQGSHNYVDDYLINSNVYPNPANEYLNIDVELEITNGIEIELFNSIGELQNVPEYAILNSSTSLRINTVQLTSGRYLLRVHNGEKSIVVNFVKK